ncbi:MAG: hypothetical protein IJ886_06225 [Prevotella sp.]|nr:hypothetical protein [Prevotella sp.]
MKDKLKKIWEKHMDVIALGITLFVLIGVMLSLSWVKHNKEEDTPMESTSEEEIKAK